MLEGHDIDGYCEAIVETITQPLLILDSNLTVEMANSAFCRCFGIVAENALGRPVYEIGNGQWNIPNLRRLLEVVLIENDKVEHYRVEHKFEDIGERVMLLDAARIRSRNAEDRIIVAISDETERECFIGELQARQEFSDMVIDSVREGLVVLDAGLHVQFANESFYDCFKITPKETEGRLIYDLGNGQWDVPALRKFLTDILPREISFDDFEVEREFEHIGRRSMLLNGRRLDHQDLILLAIRDVTERRKAKLVEETLREELRHRVDNILANVSALAMHTRRRHNTIDEFYEAFEGRLRALARAQDCLVKGPSESAELREIVRAELDAVGAEEGRDFLVHGPDVWLSPRHVQALSMTIHELTTNSAKYGALSVPAGRIDIVWRTERRENGIFLNFQWRERDGTIKDTTPSKGFGTQIIETSVPHMLGGTAELAFHPDGVTCSIVFPLTLDQGSKP